MSPRAKPKPNTGLVAELTYEQAFAEMEQIVRQLEAGQLPLDESLALFERGQALAAHCQQLLDNAELRVSQLAPRAGGGYDLGEFDADDDDAA